MTQTLHLPSKVAAICFTLLYSTFAYAQYAEHSVLGNGTWWKVGVADAGIYRIGIDEIPALAGTPLDSIGVYGYPGGVLDEYNGAKRTDDLINIPIEIVDNNNNGLFDNSDYIMTFCDGATKWSYDENQQQYKHSPNPYSAYSYFFVTRSGKVHKRIEKKKISLSETATVAHYRSLTLHERELTNTNQSGQIWVGEKFTYSSNRQSFSFTLPSASTGTIRLRYALASIATVNSSFNVDINGKSSTHSFSRTSVYSTAVIELASPNTKTVTVDITYSCSETRATGYLDYIEIDADVRPATSGNHTIINLPPSETGNRRINLEGTTAQTKLWNISSLDSIYEFDATPDGGITEIDIQSKDNVRLVAFNSNGLKKPVSVAKLENQDLHGTGNPDLLIVYNKAFAEQALRLASLHSIYDDMDVVAVNQEEVYNEFSGGKDDPIAIREMLRMYNSRHEVNPSLKETRYLLLFGKGTYDNRNITHHNLPTVITYQSETSFDDEGSSYATDDIFGYLDDGETGKSYESLDVSIGRLPAKTAGEAEHMVNKIERYLTRIDLNDSSIRGDWRNSVALLSDDADPGSGSDTLFTNSSEITARQINSTYPQYNIDKIYADAYIQQSDADGSFYPDAKNALKKRIDYGCLLLNYIGHGSSQYIGTERYMEKNDIANYANNSQLPFFITSTCTFGKYDMSDETCGAEEFLLAQGGGVACLAASRPISHIQAVNTDMVLQALNPDNRIGDAVRHSKTHHYAAHALTLMGDPALKLSFPKYRVTVTSINGRHVDGNRKDSALVLSTVVVEGEIQDSEGNLINDFDGIIFPEVYDRPIASQTLANDNEGHEVKFSKQTSLLYKGRDSVTGGRFRYQFIVPRDVAYKFEPCKLSHYARSVSEDASGAYNMLMLGGFDTNVNIKESRPDIKLYINDTTFRNGGITNQNPVLHAVLFDSIGINAVGSGLGHDITATVDGNANSTIILNDFYQTDVTSENLGTIDYKLQNLSTGWHTVTLKAWNIHNYSNSSTLRFYVTNADTARITSLSADPNPATTKTRIRAEYNCPESLDEASIKIFTVNGQLVTEFTPDIQKEGFVLGPVEWDLTDGLGRRVPHGIYLIHCTLITTAGEKLTDRGKIIVH